MEINGIKSSISYMSFLIYYKYFHMNKLLYRWINRIQIHFFFSMNHNFKERENTHLKQILEFSYTNHRERPVCPRCD